MQNMPVHDKAALLRTIANIREALDKTWNGYGDYDKVKERMARLIKALEQEPDAAHQGILVWKNIQSFLHNMKRSY